MILDPARATEHEELVRTADGSETDEGDDEVHYCREVDCVSAALPGNYGFCGRHRPYVPPGEAECKMCSRVAKSGNYGFCGYHRR
jgi:hypothetical protein